MSYRMVKAIVQKNFYVILEENTITSGYRVVYGDTFNKTESILETYDLIHALNVFDNELISLEGN